jgi:hypothetical protein
MCYGLSLSVTKIFSAMVRDKKTGGHPNLALNWKIGKKTPIFQSLHFRKNGIKRVPKMAI